MRNDFPGHPAGPLEHTPDPAQVLEVKVHVMQGWILRGCGVAMALIGMILAGVPSTPPWGGVGVCLLLAVGMFAGGRDLADNPPVVFRLRPDGVEFPRDRYPALRWADIQGIDIGTLHLQLVGGGGPQDYLGIKLRPGVLAEGQSFLSPPIRMALAAAGRDFDICLRCVDWDLNAAHTAMEMRARAEAARAAPPAAPAGMTPIGELDRSRVRAAKQAQGKGWVVILGSGFLGFFGCSLAAQPLILNELAREGQKVPEAALAPEVAMGVGLLLMMGVGMLWFSGDDDEDE